MMTTVRAALAASTLALTAAGCAAPPPGGGINDPYEGVNRSVHGFNRGVDRAVFRPASNAYGAGVPGPVRQGVSNFAENVSTPSYVLNDILQGRIGDAGHNGFRFALNTTLGLGGLFDPAGSSFGLPARESDFGQTLYVWGVRQGAYLELPLVGPSTEREAVGTVVDIATNPLRLAVPADAQPALAAARVASGLDHRYVLRATIDQILYESADSYAQARSIYLQNRQFELGEGETEAYFNPYDDILE